MTPNAPARLDEVVEDAQTGTRPSDDQPEVNWTWRERSAFAAALSSTTVLLAASVFAMALAFTEKVPCRSGAWNYYYKQFQDSCYTDIYPLYYNEGLSSKQVPYTGHHVEYPVLIGGAMQAAAWLVRNVDVAIRGREFYDVTVGLLAVCAVVGVLATARAAGPDRRWAALMVALSPALILNAFVNWDLIAMALTALAIAAWAARRGVWAGIFIGLAVATKFYPLVVLGALLLLCLRAGRLRDFAKTFAAAALAWLAVNLPIMIIAPSGWATFYVFSKNRGADWGSIWFMFEYFRLPGLGDDQLSVLNKMSAALLVVAFAAIALLALAAPRRPRLPQLCFLLLAAFLMTNKVWSPQYVVWLVPLAVLARPRLWPYVLWQLAEVGYFFGIWGYLLFVYRTGGYSFAGYQGISSGWYFTLLAARFLTVALLAAYVVRDILYPERDVVRAPGLDDPAGGVLDEAPDRFRIRLGPLRQVRRRGAASARRHRPPARRPPQASRKSPSRLPPAPRRAAARDRSSRTLCWRGGPGPSRTHRVSCCSAPGRSGR